MKNTKKNIILFRFCLILTCCALLSSVMIPYLYLRNHPGDTAISDKIQLVAFIIATFFGILLLIVMAHIGSTKFIKGSRYCLKINDNTNFIFSLSYGLNKMKYSVHSYNTPVGLISVYDKPFFTTMNYFIVINSSPQYSSWELFDEHYEMFLSDIVIDELQNKNIITLLCVNSIPDNINNNLFSYNLQSRFVSKFFAVFDINQGVIIYPKITDGMFVAMQWKLIDHFKKILRVSRLIDK